MFSTKTYLYCWLVLHITHSAVGNFEEISLAKGFTYVSKIHSVSSSLGYTYGSKSQQARLMSSSTGPNSNLNITLLKIEQVNSSPDAYSFAIPHVTVTCKCDGDTENRTFSDSDHKTSSSKATKDELSFSLLTNGMCCCVNVVPSEVRSEALFIQKQWMNYRFRLSYGHAEKSKVVILDVPESIQRFVVGNDTIVEIMERNSNTFFLPRESYSYTNVSNIVQIVHHSVNTVDEFDLQKVGWYKTNMDYTQLEDLKQKLMHALSVKLTSCLPDRTLFTWKLMAKHYYCNSLIVNNDEKIIENINGEKFEEIVLEKATKRLIVQHLRELPMRLRIVRMTDQNNIKPFLFTGFISLDKYSNRNLFLSIHGIRGTLYGTVGAAEYGPKEHITVNIPDKSDISRQIRMTSAVDGPRWVCLYPQLHPEEIVCSYVEFTEDPLSESDLGTYGLLNEYSKNSGTSRLLPNAVVAFLVALAVHIFMVRFQ